MTLPPPSSDRVLSIYLALAQYPILSSKIRAKMRRGLFSRGAIDPQSFEAEVREKAIRSQALEGLHNPFAEEPADVWEMRLSRVREHLTDFYFAYNLPYELFEQIVREVLSERGAEEQEMMVSFNPELAPQSMLFEQGLALEKIPEEERGHTEARLREIKVVLIRQLISDQLAYVNIAKEWFTMSDLVRIQDRKIGQGKIGGKAAGMLLAARILSEAGDEEIRSCMRIPESYFIGADLTYDYMALNGLMHWADQKYKEEDEIRTEFPRLQKEFLQGKFPQDVLAKLGYILNQVQHAPLIVRSSSLLEDNFGTSFAGKYESHFCPNQSTPEKNVENLAGAIKKIYASILNPDALLYRRAKGLQDYDERMAILIQVVQGEKYKDNFLPHAAGVAFSRNLYRWSPQIRGEDGFLRLVWGLGTRAVDQVANDYPRLVALSHPLLHPADSPKEHRRYSQHYVDLIDLKNNAFITKAVTEVVDGRYPILRYLAQVDSGGYLTPIHSNLREHSKENVVFTFDGLLRRTAFAERMRKILKLLEKSYRAPVDTEFTIEIINPMDTNPNVEITILQCRPQSHLKEIDAHLPKNLAEHDIIFRTSRMAPRGRIDNIDYVMFIPQESYFALPTQAARAQLGRAIGRLNNTLVGESFICVGPGRWGTSNPDLGIHIGYGDIYNTRALVEVAGGGIGNVPEASFGTHFFQDLVESEIYPLAIYLDDEDTIFNQDFFYKTPNQLLNFLPQSSDLLDTLKLIAIDTYRPGHHLELVMDDERGGQTMAFLVHE